MWGGGRRCDRRHGFKTPLHRPLSGAPPLHLSLHPPPTRTTRSERPLRGDCEGGGACLASRSVLQIAQWHPPDTAASSRYRGILQMPQHPPQGHPSAIVRGEGHAWRAVASSRSCGPCNTPLPPLPVSDAPLPRATCPCPSSTLVSDPSFGRRMRVASTEPSRRAGVSLTLPRVGDCTALCCAVLCCAVPALRAFASSSDDASVQPSLVCVCVCYCLHTCV